MIFTRYFRKYICFNRYVIYSHRKKQDKKWDIHLKKKLGFGAENASLALQTRQKTKNIAILFRNHSSHNLRANLQFEFQFWGNCRRSTDILAPNRLGGGLLWLFVVLWECQRTVSKHFRPMTGCRRR